MNIYEIADLIDATICYAGENPDCNITTAYSSDMMADVLSFAEPGCVLITGLRNAQAIRSAELKDLPCIIFSRGKTPDDEMVELAKEFGICIMYTQKPVFTTSGILYENGIRGVSTNE